MCMLVVVSGDVCNSVRQLIVPRGLAVRIPGFHPGGPGSTPGAGEFSHPTPIYTTLISRSTPTSISRPLTLSSVTCSHRQSNTKCSVTY